MWFSSVSYLLVVPLVAGYQPMSRPRQSNSTGVPSRVEDGIQTECKTCPYSLCTNQAAYEYGYEMTLTCWTRGDLIVDTNTWYKTTDDCYVTEWDIIEGNYTSVLSYCGDIPETITRGSSKTVFNTECNIIPKFVGEPEDHTKMYKQEVDLTLTCYTTDGDTVLDNSKWYKTVSNCYVPEAQIEFFDGDLDPCGPIPFMEAKMREPDPEPTSAGAVFARDQDNQLTKRWLYLTQIGDDSGPCLASADSQSKVKTVYPFGNYIIIQCASFSVNTAENDQIYLFTQDRCWVNDTKTDPSLIDDEIRSERYPNCNLFVDTQT